MTSASVNRVIMPKSTLLPTPLPANKPIRWPRPTLSKALIACTPTSRCSLTGERAKGFIGFPCKGTRSLTLRGPLPSKGLHAPSTTRPNKPSPTGTCESLRIGRTRALGTRPRISPVGIKYKVSPEKPTTSASIGGPLMPCTSQRLPTGA